MLKFKLSATLLFINFLLHAQTGPAGVGTSTNNVFWLKADKGTSSTSNNTPISAWNDQSGNGINMSQTVAAQQPSVMTNVINGYPAVLFDNVSTTNDKMIGPDSPLLDNTSGYSFFTVTKPQNLDGNARVIVSKRTTVSVDQSFMLFYYAGNKLHVDIQTTDNRFNSNAAFSSGNNYILDVIYDGTLATGVRSKIYTDETLDISAAESATLVPDNASPIILGTTDASDPRPYGGYISEVLIYRTALVPAQRTIINNYLSAKYNIALSANDKYAGDNNGNGDYDKEVAGIGKESTGSNDAFSTSVTGGIGITAVSGLDNSDYLLAGHAVAVNTLETIDVGGMSGTNNARWLRVWYIDVTNSSTQITANIQFGATDAGMGSAPLGTTASDYVLLYRAGQSGNWTELTTASAIVGDRAFFNNVVLNTDGYYTLGSKNSPTSVLPITLTSFEAGIEGAKVYLKWNTASEKNNASFTVEKTKDGNSFEAVAVVKGAGNSSSPRYYAYEDLSPQSGISYYRLKQTDFSGDNSYSQLVAVFYESEFDDLAIYPNPSDGILYVNCDALNNRLVSIQIIDALGQTRYSRSLVFDKNKLTIDIDNKLPLGNYMILITTEQKTFIRKIIFR